VRRSSKTGVGSEYPFRTRSPASSSEKPPGAAGPLDADPAARATFDGLSYSNKSWLAVTVTNMPETHARRIEKSIAALRKGRVR
jgi:uncharacterized protein YdeI (YjbR/CyaY-like superfamily)